MPCPPLVAPWSTVHERHISKFSPVPLISHHPYYPAGIAMKLRLICVSLRAVGPTGNVCVMASLRALSKRMRIRRRRPCRQAPAGNPEPPFNPRGFCCFRRHPY